MADENNQTVSIDKNKALEILKHDNVNQAALEFLVQNDPGALLYNSKLLDGNPDKDDIIRIFAEVALTKDPKAVIDNYKLLDGDSNQSQAIEQAIKNVLNQNPSTILNKTTFSNQDEVVTKAIQNVLAKNPDAVLVNYKLLRDNTHEKEIIAAALQNAATVDPGQVLYDAVKFPAFFEGNLHKKEIVDTAIKNAITNDPGALLANNSVLDDRADKDKIIAGATKAALVNDPGAILNNSSLLDSAPNKKILIKAAIVAAVTKSPAAILNNADLLEGNPDKNEIIANAARNIATPDDSNAVLNHSILLKGLPDENDIIANAINIALTNDPADPGAVLNNAKLLDRYPKDKKQTLKIAFQEAAISDPDAVLKNAKLLDGNPDKEQILKTAYQHALTDSPASILDNPKSLDGDPNKAQKVAEAIKATLVENPSYLIAHSELLNGNPDKNKIIEEAAQKAIKSDPNFASSFVYYINDHHEESDAQRFALLKDLNTSQKFDVICAGSSWSYTSTYLGVLNSTLDDLKRDKKSLTDVLSPAQMKQMPDFLTQAASYNRMDDVLKVITKEKLPAIVHELANQAEWSSDLNNSFTLVSLLKASKGNPELRHQLEAEVKSHYESAKTTEEKDRFGLIASAYVHDNPDSASPDMKAIAQNPRYQLSEMPTLERRMLTDKHGTCNQLMVFAEDEDSKNSFAHFKETYANKKDWKIEDKGSYICVESTNGSGVPVRIYANKPDHHDDGLAAINTEVAQRQGQPTAEFQVFAARGHSYHDIDYLPFITKDMHLVQIASCGGFHDQGKVLQSSPDAQIIETQQVGSMYVNDPLFFSINESLRTHGSVDWQQQQKVLNHLGSSEKDFYLLPDNNTALKMQIQYNKLEKSNAAPEGKENTLPPIPPPPPPADAPVPSASNNQMGASVDFSRLSGSLDSELLRLLALFCKSADTKSQESAEISAPSTPTALVSTTQTRLS